MKIKLFNLRRIIYASVGLALASTFLMPALMEQAAAAYPQITSRSIQMSDAQASDTNVSYKVSFSNASTGNVQAIIVDFCDNDPLVLDTTCTAPGGFSLTATPAVSSQSSTAGCNISTFTTAAQQNSNRTLELSAASAVNFTSAPCAITFTITTVTNPNTANHTFYARIYTYDTTAHANSYAAGGSTGVVDAGGIALSTSNTIQITANVQEELSFCVSGVAIDDSGGQCTTTGGLTSPALTIGHTVGSVKVLDNTAVDTANAFTEISTNALNGWVINMKAFNSCTGLSRDNGSTCPIAGQANAVVTAGEHNTNPGGAFVMCVHKGSNTTVAATYNDSVNACPTGGFNATSDYGMGTTTNTYGDQIASGSSGVLEEQNTCVFAATAAAVTPAGTYKANESLIATGTF